MTPRDPYRSRAIDHFVGDLRELYARRRARGPRWRAHLWLVRELAIAVVRMPWREPLAVEPLPAGDPTIMAFRTELGLAARRLRQAPSFTLLCTLTLALGIGAVTALFAVVNPVLLRPLPYPRGEQIVLVNELASDGTASNTGFATFADLARETQSLASAAAIGGWDATLSGTNDAERVNGERVSATYFRTLGVKPAIGRDFAPDEDMPGHQRVVILSHGLWARRFASDSGIIGRTIPIDDIPHVVAGVMPERFVNVVNADVQIWRVLGYASELPYACRSCRHLRMIARVRDGVPIATATAELTRVEAAVVRDHPKDYAVSGVIVTSLKDAATKAVRPTLLAMLGAVALVLMLAAANVANLQLGRAVRREGEFAIRSALGAGRSQLARQLLAEGLLLAGTGAIAGIAFAAASLAAIRTRLPANMPRTEAIALDAPTLGVAAAVALFLSGVVGLAPLWRGGSATRGWIESLRTGTRLISPARQVMRALLVGAEVALALTLLAGAGLLTRSLGQLMRVNAGFDPRGVVTVETQASGARYREDAQVNAHHDAVRAAVAAIPGVTGVATASQLPLGGNVDQYGVRAFDKPLPNPELAPSSDRYAVSGDYFRVMRIPLRAGRAFVDADDREAAAPVAIVSEALARRIWRGEDPLGKRIQMGDTSRAWRTVIGVVGDVRHAGLDAAISQQVYVPARQWYFSDNTVTLVARTDGDPARLAGLVRNAVIGVDPMQPVGRVATMPEVVAVTTAQRRLARTLFLAFASVALVLAAAGIYGVLAGQIAERTREIGLRRALGASPSTVVRGVVSQAARLAVPGLVVGIAGAAAVGKLLHGLLFGVTAVDPITLAAVAGTLALVALVACLAPALRALGIGPMAALREHE